VGDPFNRYAMQATADSDHRRLKDRGYPDARVTPPSRATATPASRTCSSRRCPGTARWSARWR
jgi:hypothetical protein